MFRDMSENKKVHDAKAKIRTQGWKEGGKRDTDFAIFKKKKLKSKDWKQLLL